MGTAGQESKGTFESLNDIDHLDVPGFSGQLVTSVDPSPGLDKTCFGKGLEDVGNHVARESEEIGDLFCRNLLTGTPPQAGKNEDPIINAFVEA